MKNLAEPAHHKAVSTVNKVHMLKQKDGSGKMEAAQKLPMSGAK